MSQRHPNPRLIKALWAEFVAAHERSKRTLDLRDRIAGKAYAAFVESFTDFPEKQKYRQTLMRCLLEPESGTGPVHVAAH